MVEPTEGAKAMGEESVVKEVRAALEKDIRSNFHSYPISIAVENGDLILEGEVEDIIAKKLALVTAAKTHGVQRIVDRLKVAPAEKMGDAEIRDHVCRVLIEEAALEHCFIQRLAGDELETVRKPTPEYGGSIAVAATTVRSPSTGKCPA